MFEHALSLAQTPRRLNTAAAGAPLRPPWPCRPAASTGQVSSRPVNGRTRPSRISSSLNSRMRRERPGSGASSTGAPGRDGLGHHGDAVLRDDDRVGQGEQAEIGVLARSCPTSSRLAARAAASAARASGEVRRDGVSATPTRSVRIIASQLRGEVLRHRRRPAGSGRCCRRPAPRPAAAAGGPGGAPRSRRPRPGASGVTRCSAVRVTTTLGPVRPSWRLTTTTSNRAGSMRGCWICTTGRPGRAQPGGDDRGGAAGGHDQPVRHRREADGARAGSGQSRAVHPGPGRARRSADDGRVESGGFGQAERLRSAGRRRARPGWSTRWGRCPRPGLNNQAGKPLRLRTGC